MAVSESEIIPLPNGIWLINGNCFTQAFCNNDEKIAMQYAQTLVNCFGCMDCVNCMNCNQCINCSHCKDCDFCQDCSFCSACNYSFSVTRQKGYSSVMLLPPPMPTPPQSIMQQSKQMKMPFTQMNQNNSPLNLI